MCLSTRIATLCVGHFVSHQAAAAKLPQRWVSALGAESKLVGVDTVSQHPESPGNAAQ
jgi:iron complex transport system substrate-binding protein